MKQDVLIKGAAISWRKPGLFALWAALGALGGALLGELWLLLSAPAPLPPPPKPVAPPAQAVVLLLDTSGSMEGAALDEVKQAADAYIERQDTRRTRIGVVAFNSRANVISVLSRDKAALEAGVNSLQVDGVTRMDLGLDMALQQLQGAPENPNILLFTDGLPQADDYTTDAESLTVQSAQRVRAAKVRLLAIATGGAERSFLEQLTGDARLVFEASGGQFGEAFAQAEAIITPSSGQLITSAPAQNLSRRGALIRIAVWTALLGLGIATSLLVAQKRYARQPLAASDALSVAGGLLAGAAAGVAGQILFDATSSTSALSLASRVAAWALLGGALGWGTALFVPNLPSQRAAQGGALGGALGAGGFLMASSLAGDVAGRWLGSAILGACIGLAVVLAEVAFRQAWLHVSYGPKDAFDLSLGAEAILVGSDRSRCGILAREAAPVAASYGLESGRIYIEQNGRRTSIQSGDSRNFGNVSVTVSGTAATTSADPGAAVGSGFIEKDGTLYAPRSHAPAAPIAAPVVAQAPVVAAPIPIAAPKKSWILAGGATPLRLPESAITTIGRGSQNSIVLGDAGISSQHARLKAGASTCSITDLGSTNGTFLNGERLAPQVSTPLKPGDQLRLGQTSYTIQHEAASA